MKLLYTRFHTKATDSAVDSDDYLKNLFQTRMHPLLTDDYNSFIEYAEGNRSSFRNIRALKDSIDGIKPEEIVAVLNQYIENSKFENCFPNKDYCEALGFNSFLLNNTPKQ